MSSTRLFRLLRSSLFAFGFTAVATFPLHAGPAIGPGFHQVHPPPSSDMPTEPVPAPGFPSDPLMMATQSASVSTASSDPVEDHPMSSQLPGYAEAITPQIQNLAESLGSDPQRIFSHVYETIAYEHYFGSRKGATLTLLEAGGNDWDQASLLVALLRAAGHRADYKWSYKRVPYAPDNPAYPAEAKVPDAIGWWGLAEEAYPDRPVTPPPGWSIENHRRWLNMRDYANEGGFLHQSEFDYPDTLGVSHITVRLELPEGGYRLLDPSAKNAPRGARRDLIADTTFDAATFLNRLDSESQSGTYGGQTVTYAMTRLNHADVMMEVRRCATALASTLRTEVRSRSVAEVLSRQALVLGSAPGLEDADPLADLATLPPDYFGKVPQGAMTRYVLSIDSQPPIVVHQPRLGGATLSLAREGVDNVLRLGADELLRQPISPSINGCTLALDVTHYAFWDNTNTEIFNQIADHAIICPANETRVITYGLSYGPGRIGDAEHGLRLVEQAAPSAARERQLVAERLNLIGLRWFSMMQAADHTLHDIVGENGFAHHSLGFFSQGARLGLDIGYVMRSTYRQSGKNADDHTTLLASSFYGSALEHGILDQLNVEPFAASSAVRSVTAANRNGDLIYLINPNTADAILPQLMGYSTSQRAGITATAHTSGSHVIAPRNFRQDVRAYQSVITGGWMEITPSSVAMLFDAQTKGASAVFDGPFRPKISTSISKTRSARIKAPPSTASNPLPPPGSTARSTSKATPWTWPPVPSCMTTPISSSATALARKAWPSPAITAHRAPTTMPSASGGAGRITTTSASRPSPPRCPPSDLPRPPKPPPSGRRSSSSPS